MRRIGILLLVLALAAGAVALLQHSRRQQLEAARTALAAEQSRAADFAALPRQLTDNTEALALLDQTDPTPPAQALHTYLSPEGIRFESDCEAWDETMLEALYQELLQNRHGAELNTLSRVTVYPQADEFAAATHAQTRETNELHLRTPVLPDRALFTFTRSAGVISLYGGEENTTVASMASSLSHEYGHHFTLTYLLSDERGANQYYESQYAQLRGLRADNSFVNTGNAQTYYDNHSRYVVEIAAEDYVTLMGSPLSRTVGEYKDVEEYLQGLTSETELRRNAAPQENMRLPLAQDVPGLAELFYGAIDQPVPDLPQTRDFSLHIEPGYRTYNLTTGTQTFTHYTITWDKVFGEDAVYTLISAKDQEDFMPIRTVTGSEAASATVGKVTADRGTQVQIYDDGLAQGHRTFLVTALLPDGRICVSLPMDYDF